MASTQTRISLVLDPRFPGGTSSAVAQEIPELLELCPVEIIGITSGMFPEGTPINPTLEAVLQSHGLDIKWDPAVVSSDVIVLHNPSFLKFEAELNTRFVCDQFVVVTHENFLAPDGSPVFDAEACFDLLDEALLTRQKTIAPVSDYNRETAIAWSAQTECDWDIADANWFNICTFEMTAPTSAPRDRRGRHSRPGFEKFPDMETMETLFPPSCDTVAILGANTLRDVSPPAHWSLFDFRDIPVSQLLDRIDFFVYFTNPRWRESFGRVLAEAVAAGKLVITDPKTAQNIGEGLVGTTPDQVQTLIEGFIADPQSYQRTVLDAQNTISNFSAETFRGNVAEILGLAGVKR